MVSTFDAQLTVDSGLLIFVVGQLKVRRCGVIKSGTLQCTCVYVRGGHYMHIIRMRPRAIKVTNIKERENLKWRLRVK